MLIPAGYNSQGAKEFIRAVVAIKVISGTI
jgi:hypothetical protein